MSVVDPVSARPALQDYMCFCFPLPPASLSRGGAHLELLPLTHSPAANHSPVAHHCFWTAAQSLSWLEYWITPLVRIPAYRVDLLLLTLTTSMLCDNMQTYASLCLRVRIIWIHTFGICMPSVDHDLVLVLQWCVCSCSSARCSCTQLLVPLPHWPLCLSTETPAHQGSSERRHH